MKIGLGQFWHDQRGVTAMEYALIASLVAVVIIAAVASIGTSVNERFASVASQMPQ